MLCIFIWYDEALRNLIIFSFIYVWYIIQWERENNNITSKTDMFNILQLLMKYYKNKYIYIFNSVKI
jgi:hypothetical protein